MTGCPDDRCDGSGFLYDEDRRTARPCSCRPARLARRRASAVAGRLPRRFREVGFDREPVPSIERANPHAVSIVRDFVASLPERLDAGRGLWFTGKVGTGKTTLAMLVARDSLEADRTVAIYSLPRLLALLRDTYHDDSPYSINALIDRVCAVDLLHIDDVGAEQSSAWVLEQLYTIVNTRYEDGRSIVLTTNLDVDELREQIGERTVSRLSDMCTGVPLCGEDQRGGEGLVRELPEPQPARGAGRWLDDDAFVDELEERPAYGRRLD